MEELFANLNLEDSIEVETSAASSLTTDSMQEAKSDPGQTASRQEQPNEDANLIEVNVPENSTKSSLNTEKKTVASGKNNILDAEVSDILSKKEEPAVQLTDENKEDKKSPDQKSAEAQDSPSSSPFVLFAKALHEDGVLSSFDETKFKEGTIEELSSAVKEEIVAGVQAYKESLPSEVKDLIENYEEGVPLDALIAAKSRQIEYENIKDEDLKNDKDLQKQLLTQDLLMRGYTEQDAKEMIQDAEDLGKLEAKSRVSLNKLKEVSKAQQEEMKKQVAAYKEQLEKQQKEQLVTIKKQIDETAEIIPGIALNKNVRDKLYQSMTTIVETDSEGRPMNAVMALRAKNPMEFEKKLHYYVTLGLFNEKPDITKVMTVAKSSAAKEFEELANKNLGLKGGLAVKEVKYGAKEDLKSSLAMFQKGS